MRPEGELSDWSEDDPGFEDDSPESLFFFCLRPPRYRPGGRSLRVKGGLPVGSEGGPGRIYLGGGFEDDPDGFEDDPDGFEDDPDGFEDDSGGFEAGA